LPKTYLFKNITLLEEFIDFISIVVQVGNDIFVGAGTLWNKVENSFDKIPSIWEQFKEVIKGFGTSIHQGVGYCAHFLQKKTDNVSDISVIRLQCYHHHLVS